MNDRFQASDVSVLIPTYRREQVLLDAVRSILEQTYAPGKVVVIDQTPEHETNTQTTLRRWATEGRIRLICLSQPSQPHALNIGLQETNTPLVLTLDDDIVPVHDLVQKHAAAHGDPNVWAVVGQVLQPGQVPEDHIVGPPDEGLLTHLEFRFNSTRRCLVRNGMSGNMSIRRDRAIQIGGFDENFCYTVAYRFETEFGRRIWKRGGKILFEPEASIRHLRVVRGGTRTGADHLRSHQPDHSIGDYYFALQHGLNMESIRYISHRFLRSVCTRFHLRHPWWIPPKLLGELRGLIGAVRLVRQGPKLLQIKDS